MNRSKRFMGDDVRMTDPDEDDFLNRLHGVEHAEFVRPSDADPAGAPEQCAECGSRDVRPIHKMRLYALFLALVFGVGLAVDQTLAAFLLALAGSIFFVIGPRWRCAACGRKW